MTDGYTLNDLKAMQELNRRNGGWYSPSGVIQLDDWIEKTRTSNLKYLLARCYDPDTAVRAAWSWDWRRRPSAGYREYFVPESERTPVATDRDWMLSCGYDEAMVEEKIAEDEAETARLAAEREARERYNRSLRGRTKKAWREAQYRMSTARDVLAGKHECGDW